MQIAWTRYIVFVGMAFLLTTQMRGASFRVRASKLQVARGLCLGCSSLLFVPGIRDVGLAEATTIGFIGPILVTFLSIPRSPENPKILGVDDSEIVGDLVAIVAPFSGHLDAQEVQD